jgi:hypothetical protein
LEIGGDRRAALVAYRAAVGAASSDTERRQASLGVARQLLADNPLAAREQVAAIASGPSTPERWEAHYLVAVSSSLLGDKTGANQSADRAWSDAAGASLNDLAPLRVATLRAGLAAANHEVALEKTMLTASNGLSLTAAPALSAQMPVCGDNGVSPSDFVIFAYASGPWGVRQLTPVATSRPEIVAVFQDALGPIDPIKEGGGRKPIGTVFTVSCRTVVNGRFVESRSELDPILSWFVEKGLYPAITFNEADDVHLNSVADRVDFLAAKFGKSSVLLTEPKWQRLTMLMARARSGDPVLPGQITDLGAEVSADLRSHGAPDWIPGIIESQIASMTQGAAAADDMERFAIFVSMIRDQLQKLPVRISYVPLQGMVSSLPDAWPAAAAQIVVDHNARVLPALTGRQRQAWLLTVAEAQRELGKSADAAKTIGTAGLDKDLCIAGDSPPELLEQHFSYSDYPDSLIAGEQEGAVFYEFNLTLSGSVTGPRIIYSLPSNLFDEASAKGLSTVRYVAPTRKGKPSPCRAVYQPIVWRLGDETNYAVPSLMPDIGPTT